MLRETFALHNKVDFKNQSHWEAEKIIVYYEALNVMSFFGDDRSMFKLKNFAFQQDF